MRWSGETGIKYGHILSGFPVGSIPGRTALDRGFGAANARAIEKSMKNTHWPPMNADFDQQAFAFSISVNLRSSAANLFARRADEPGLSFRRY